MTVIDRYYSGNQSVIETKKDDSSEEENLMVEKAKKKEVEKKSLAKAKMLQQNILNKKIETLMSAPTLLLQQQAVLPQDIDINKIKVASDTTVDSIDKQSYINSKLEMKPTKAEFDYLKRVNCTLIREHNKENAKLEMLQKSNAKEMDKIKLELKNLKIKHENLLEEFNEKMDKIESLQIQNAKLQIMVSTLKSDGHDTGGSKNFSKLLDNPSPPLSLVKYAKDFASEIKHCSSPMTANARGSIDESSDETYYSEKSKEKSLDNFKDTDPEGNDIVERYSEKMFSDYSSENIVPNSQEYNCSIQGDRMKFDIQEPGSSNNRSSGIPSKSTKRKLLNDFNDDIIVDGQQHFSEQHTAKKLRQTYNTDDGHKFDDYQPHHSSQETLKLTKQNYANQSSEKKEKTNKYKLKGNLKMMDKSTAGRKFLEKYTANDGVKMIYLRHDLSISYDDWKDIMRCNSESLFSKKLLRSFFSPSKFRSRYVKVGSTVLTPNGRNKRTEISPEKKSAVTKALEYFINKRQGATSQGTIDRKTAKVTHYFSEEINDTKERK